MSDQERQEVIKECLKMASEASLSGDEKRAATLVKMAREFAGKE